MVSSHISKFFEKIYYNLVMSVMILSVLVNDVLGRKKRILKLWNRMYRTLLALERYPFREGLNRKVKYNWYMSQVKSGYFHFITRHYLNTLNRFRCVTCVLRYSQLWRIVTRCGEIKCDKVEKITIASTKAHSGPIVKLWSRKSWTTVQHCDSTQLNP